MLDRERRPDGCAHRRLDHGRSRIDADRPRIPASARHRDRGAARRRCRHRRLQHSVRRRAGDRPRHRRGDEPAGVAVVGVGEQGHRLSDREDRREAGAWLHARRDPERHHQADAGQLRAEHRLRRGEGAAVRVREVSRCRRHVDDHDEERRRSNVDRPQLHRGACRRRCDRSSRPVRRFGGTARSAIARR